MKVPYFGEGIACVHNFSLEDSDVEWFNSTFVNNFMDFKDYGKKINIIDNKICFSYFHPYTYLDLNLNLDFFKKKNDENVKKFKVFIKERYNKIKNQYKDENSVFCYKIPNGKYKIFSMMCNTSFKDSVLQKDIPVGDFIKVS